MAWAEHAPSTPLDEADVEGEKMRVLILQCGQVNNDMFCTMPRIATGVGRWRNMFIPLMASFNAMSCGVEMMIAPGESKINTLAAFLFPFIGVTRDLGFLCEENVGRGWGS
jgi:hypothetical protein